MPNPEQIRFFWLRWIDKQYAKADPSHVKLRSEFSTGEGVIAESFPKRTFSWASKRQAPAKSSPASLPQN
jgi:hypothetical protein